jgi:hypothetical protein
MEKACFIRVMCRFILTLVACGLLAQAKQSFNPYPGVLTSPVDSRTVVRFYFLPLPADRYHYPLVLRVAEPNDERLKVAPILAEGRTAHISLSEMQELVARMTRSITMGQQTRGVEVLGDFRMIPITVDMDVVVIFSNGAARGLIPKEQIWKVLSSLDSAIRAPRAHWEFQRFRLGYGCCIPGFDEMKYSW